MERQMDCQQNNFVKHGFKKSIQCFEWIFLNKLILFTNLADLFSQSPYLKQR